MQFVVSLTTIPDRVPYLEITIASLLQQSKKPDAIYVCLPHYSKRFQKPYPLPTFTDERIKLVRCQDYGPATKILGLLAECPPEITNETRIVFCDDDRIYDHGHLEALYDASLEKPNTVICLATSPHWKYFIAPATTYEYNSELIFPAGRHNYSDGYMDIFEGFGGVLVHKTMFDSRVFDIPSEIQFVDDIWLSGHVKVNKLAIWGVSFTIPACHSGNDVSPLYALSGHQERKFLNQKAIEWYQQRHSIWKDVASRIEPSCLIPVFESLIYKFNAIFPQRPFDTPRETLSGSELVAFLTTNEEWAQTLTSRANEMLTDLSKLHHQLQSLRLLEEYRPKEIETTLLRKLEAKRGAFTSIMEEYNEYVRQQTLPSKLKHRLLCQVCKQAFLDGVYVSCGHGVCLGCKSVQCKICKKTVSFQHLSIG